MTRKELQILREVINAVARRDKAMWRDLKSETECGPFFGSFPYHPAAANLWEEASRQIALLPEDKKQQLVALWRSIHPHVRVTNESAILENYSMCVIDKIVERARVAQNRTIIY
jgi:hypothetical protein